MAKYNYLNYSKIQKLCQDFPDDKKEQLQALISKGYHLGHRALQTFLDFTDAEAHSIATAVVLRQASCLHISSLPKKV